MSDNKKGLSQKELPTKALLVTENEYTISKIHDCIIEAIKQLHEIRWQLEQIMPDTQNQSLPLNTKDVF